MKKKILILIAVISTILLTGCDLLYDNTETKKDIKNTLNIGDKLVNNQPTPTDIDYSLERYNLIKRAYWVNGMRDRANSLPSPIADMPLGYVVLISQNGTIIGRFIVDGKISSLNSYLTPDSEYYEYSCGNSCAHNEWLPDVDGSYGANDNGIFFFTTDGKYIEWTGDYLYSDIPFIVKEPIIKIGE